jgi:hypothetical protein
MVVLLARECFSLTLRRQPIHPDREIAAERAAMANVDARSMTLRQAALTAGFCLLAMLAAAPFAELVAYPQVLGSTPDETLANVNENGFLFSLMIVAYFATFCLDIVVAWALFVLLRPAGPHLSALAAMLRFGYAVISIAALFNLVSVARLVSDPDILKAVSADALASQAHIWIKSFRAQWHFALALFGAYLLVIGYLVIKSKHIPRLLGVALVVPGLGYLITSLKPYLWPNLDTSLATFAYAGEIIFVVWLLVGGWFLKPRTEDAAS